MGPEVRRAGRVVDPRPRRVPAARPLNPKSPIDLEGVIVYGTSHQTFRTGTIRTEDGCRIRRQRPSRQTQLRAALAEQTGRRP